MGITLTKYKETKSLLLFINFIIFLKKFKFIYKFIILNNRNTIYLQNILLLQKKSNLYFKSDIFSSKLLKKKILTSNIKKARVKGKRKNYFFNQLNFKKANNYKLKFFRIKEHFTKKIKL